MAELQGGTGHAPIVTRARLRRYYKTPHPLTPFLNREVWDIARPHQDDFGGPAIDTNKWTVANGGGAGATSPAVTVGIVNGVVDLITGTANDATASSTLAGGRHYQGQLNAVILARLTILTANTSVKVEVGFRDAITDGQIVNSKSGNTFTATDGVCWIYDTSDTGRGWDGMGVANATAATRMTTYNVVPTAGTYEYLGIALVGTLAYFFHLNADGGLDFSETVMTGAITTDVLVSPHVNVRARSATSKTVRLDYITAFQGRTTV